ncbi:hypothetical protein IGI04_002600 [Brassica rapa subsp. trilocularis]|uniref:Uncharacterized protein n=1 Tax=Brassica rapa subsp. trilocularis TaxID=1813537 RepID=A0ABQ7NW33_BRACM|nr:hypothetical protein IGI04_002600 [Brassica rapa subsp. trilocularis]
MGWWEASLNWLRRASKCGKTSLINVVENVGYSEDLDPIIGFHMREVIKRNVTFKIWDASGQSRFRSSWERFVHVGVLLSCYRGLQLFTDREVCCFMISCKKYANIDEVFDWLLKHSKSNKFLSLLCCVPCSRLFSRVKQEFAPAAGLFQSGLVSI